MRCPYCNSDKTPQRRGGRRLHCTDCGKWFSEEASGSRVEYGRDFINVVCSSPRVMSQDDIAALYKINLDDWSVEKYIVKTTEGYRKDRQVSWDVSEGVVTNGRVRDSGKMLVVTLFHHELRLVRKVAEVRARDAIEEMLEDARKHAPKYPKIRYPKSKDGVLYELDFPDIHLGKLTWAEETGEDYDIQITARIVNDALGELLGYSKAFSVSKILLPIGNDYFNVDNKSDTTTAGTPQQEDTRWQKTFRFGRQLAVSMIDQCASVAPVDVLIVAGNHDEQRTFYLGDALECWYHKNPNVSIDNGAKARKYYSFGKNLIGFTHGSDEPLEKLPSIMPIEKPELWAASKFREWHVGDKHHKKNMSVNADEIGGVVIRQLRSLTAPDSWHSKKGFVGAIQAAESFVWHPNNGMIAQFAAVPARSR